MMRKRHLEILGYHVVQVRVKPRGEQVECGVCSLLLVSKVQENSPTNVFICTYRSLILNGTPWNSQLKMLGRNILGRKYFQICLVEGAYFVN